MPKKAERNAEVCRLYEAGELSMDKIGAQFGIHGSRVAQIVKAEGKYVPQNGGPLPLRPRIVAIDVSIEDERWRPVVGYEGRYEVSDYGRVRNSRDGHIKTLIITPNGYVAATLPGDGRSKQVRVHRMVAAAFIPNPNALPEVNHLDTNRTNNRDTNLEWSDPKANRSHSVALGRYNATTNPRRQKKLSVEDVIELRALYHKDRWNIKALGDRYGINPKTAYSTAVGIKRQDIPMPAQTRGKIHHSFKMNGMEK